MRLIHAAILLLSALTSPLWAYAAAAPVTPLDASVKHHVIATLVRELNDRYVFPERALTAGKAVLAAERSGAYAAIDDPDVFAKAVTDMLAKTLHDKHLHVRYSPGVLPPTDDSDPKNPQQIADDVRFYRSVNFGIEKEMRLGGNVGYLDVRGFPPAEMMGDTLAAVMKVVSNTEGLIIDLRANGGGSPSGVALLASYFLSTSPPVHINDIFKRTAKSSGGKTEQFWTAPVPGPQYLGKTVYLLTSARTFSGGEEFAYDMQTQKRATLVGETTGGGANPGGIVRLSDHFEAFVPDGRAINPLTRTNWEGVGVKPDIPTGADAALATAYLSILRAKSAAATDPHEREQLDGLVAQVTKDSHSILLQP